jgi:hypothetical protein
MSRRETATRDDLAGGKLHGAWATGQNGITSRNLLGLLGSRGRKTEGGGRRGEVVAGVGATTSARR